MIFEAQTNAIFIPATRGNRETSTSNQIKVYIKRPSIEERRELIRVEMSVGDTNNKESKERNFMRVDNYTGKILRNHVLKIENLQIRDTDNDDKLIDIKTGEELAKVRGAFGLRELVEEICSEVLKDELEDEDELKNF